MQTIRFKVADGREQDLENPTPRPGYSWDPAPKMAPPQDFEKFWSEHGEALKAAWHHGKTISVYSIGWQLVHGLALWVNMC